MIRGMSSSRGTRIGLTGHRSGVVPKTLPRVHLSASANTRLAAATPVPSLTSCPISTSTSSMRRQGGQDIQFIDDSHVRHAENLPFSGPCPPASLTPKRA